MTGYSSAPLIDKLGIKPFLRTTILRAPEHFIDLLGRLPNGVIIEGELHEKYAYIHYFCNYRVELEKKFPILKEHLYPTGMLWISWPKGGSGVETDLDENIIRDIGVINGLVDVKVCAIDDVWSGLKFIYRLKYR
jgi:hypothetical protein